MKRAAIHEIKESTNRRIHEAENSMKQRIYESTTKGGAFNGKHMDGLSRVRLSRPLGEVSYYLLHFSAA